MLRRSTVICFNFLREDICLRGDCLVSESGQRLSTQSPPPQGLYASVAKYFGSLVTQERSPALTPHILRHRFLKIADTRKTGDKVSMLRN